MINFAKTTILYVLNSIEYRISLLIITLGLLFTIVQYADAEYSFMVFSSLTNKTLIVAILLPCFIFITYKTLNYINHNANLLLKLNNRISLIKYTIISILILSLILFFLTFLITLIISNITQHHDFQFTNVLGFGCSDIIIMIIELIKFYLLIFLFSLMSIFLYYHFKSKSISILFMLLLCITLFFFSRLITGNIVIDTFNPSFHFLGHGYTNSVLELVISGILYYSITYSLLILLLRKKIKREDIGI